MIDVRRILMKHNESKKKYWDTIKRKRNENNRINDLGELKGQLAMQRANNRNKFKNAALMMLDEEQRKKLEAFKSKKMQRETERKIQMKLAKERLMYERELQRKKQLIPKENENFIAFHHEEEVNDPCEHVCHGKNCFEKLLLMASRNSNEVSSVTTTSRIKFKNKAKAFNYDQVHSLEEARSNENVILNVLNHNIIHILRSIFSHMDTGGSNVISKYDIGSFHRVLHKISPANALSESKLIFKTLCKSPNVFIDEKNWILFWNLMAIQYGLEIVEENCQTYDEYLESTSKIIRTYNTEIRFCIQSY